MCIIITNNFRQILATFSRFRGINWVERGVVGVWGIEVEEEKIQNFPIIWFRMYTIMCEGSIPIENVDFDGEV